MYSQKKTKHPNERIVLIMKKSLKATACICAGIMSLSAISVAASADNTPTGTAAVTAQAETKAPKAKNVKLGKVTAVNGSEITLALGEYAKKQKTDDTDTAKEKAAVKPEKKTADSTESNSGSTGKKAAGKRGGKQKNKGSRSGEFTENGSTLTVTLAENNTLGKNGKTVSAADIKVGDIITLEYDESGELVGIKTAKAHTGKAKSGTEKTKTGTKEKSTRKTNKTGTEQTENA